MGANSPLFPSLTQYGLGAGLKNEYVTVLPPATRVTYVRSTGVQSGDPQEIAQRLLPTLAAGLAECRSGMGDIVYVLPGHSESVTDATMLSALVAGTRIIGLGDLNRSDAPTFTWTATASQWAISVADVAISGLRLLMDGANGVVKAINITAPGCRISGNFMRWASGAALKATIAIEVGSTALNCVIAANEVQGTATHNVTDGIKVVGATVPSGLKILGNTIIASATAANGLIHVTVAALGIVIAGNILYNTHTSSSATVALDNVAMDGVLYENYSGVKDTGQTPATTGIVVGGAAVLAVCFQNFATDTKATSGALSPAVVT